MDAYLKNFTNTDDLDIFIAECHERRRELVKEQHKREVALKAEKRAEELASKREAKKAKKIAEIADEQLAQVVRFENFAGKLKEGQVVSIKTRSSIFDVLVAKTTVHGIKAPDGYFVPYNKVLAVKLA